MGKERSEWSKCKSTAHTTDDWTFNSPTCHTGSVRRRFQVFKFPRFPAQPPSRQKNSAAFCPRTSCGWRTELVKEEEDEKEAVSAAAAPLIISSVAAGRVTIDSTSLLPLLLPPPPPSPSTPPQPQSIWRGRYLTMSFDEGGTTDAEILFHS